MAAARKPNPTRGQSAHDSLRASIDTFVADLTSLFRDSILNRVAGEGGGQSRGRPRGARKVGPAPRRGAKRDPQVIAAITEKLASFIARNPGQRMEQIGKALRLSTGELVLSAKKLLAEKRISTRGQRRATTYHPAGRRRGRAAEAAPKAKKAPARARRKKAARARKKPARRGGKKG